MPATNTATNFLLIQSYGEAEFTSMTAALEMAFLYESLGRSVSVCGPRGWIYVNGRFVGDLAK